MHSYNRTDHKTELQVITRIARGIKYQEIYEEVGVPVSTIKKIKRRNVELLFEVKQEIIKKDAVTAARILHKSRTLLERRLDRALAGLETISTKELVATTKEMFSQSQVEKNEDTESNHQELSPERSQAMLEAIKTDDTVTLARLLFRENKT